ncbi:type II-A CRISPR-associated protein Csn2 [Lactobacillus kefiranofaciens subsp. kefirgranum]|uniref:type II-A CRISPR-associated protein Csn2 n=1 Tax=Lactobacillus kefiranofaciens TaxID=267818 RepID=UPI000BA5B51A|nr:type II-A CRISPR-associated protein Csn2 [Lactobacillus kefiranofaciens]MCJ2172419.1 type II-A CRISPR-associated protein Csn2 [Lactobacillus kefiranofaciens]PAK97806.1 type II-A CRISPR-associated protein Csn2 [Lactobacillus kefiranofaciens]URW71033.1 type II-A CRISPR-associated protein Csn2 [Lactobacillus kefiranofaciens subsp. kefirgranum]URW72979.1 type II-A CRISPR-associated protein Csn2 [Lactobacillus kefiranofaciens subsp. kefirgranum]
MILSYVSHKEFNLEKSGLKIIATRSTIAYRDLIQGFRKVRPTLICSNNKYEPLDIARAFDFVGDILLTENIIEKYMSHILRSYIQKLDEENRNKIFSAYHNLESLLQDSLLLEDLPLEIDFNEDLKKLLKAENLHLDTKLLREPYVIIESILEIHQMCKMGSVPVICNVANYLNSQRLQELSNLVKQMNMKLILIEFTDKDFLIVPKNAEFFYIDEDLVDWY